MSDRSNILKIFNPSQNFENNNNNKNVTDEDCLGCNVFNSMFLLTGGSYLLSGYPVRKNVKWTLQEYNKIHPKWWRTSLRSVGGGVVLFGLYRSVETFRIWRKVESSKLNE